MKPNVSVIITTYNYGQFVEEAVQSVLHQTYAMDALEIIVVDDGSTDDTRQRLRQYNNRINYYYKDNGGHASALNLGFEKSSGEIICFLDADDRFKEDKIKNLDQYYTRHGCKALFHNAELFGQSIKTGQSLYRDECLDGLERIEDKLYRLTLDRIESAFYYLVILSAQSYRREICEKLFPIPSIYTNYTDWPLRNLALLYTDIHYCNESLLLYRQHSSSHTRITGKDLEQKKLRITLLDHLTNELRVRDTIGQASRLIQLQEDHMHLAKYTLAKAMGHKFLALKHVLYSNPYPHVSFVYRLIRRWDLMLSVVLPAVIYRFMKVMYKTLGLRELRKVLLHNKDEWYVK